MRRRATYTESTIVIKLSPTRKLVGDTDVGKQLKTKIKDLEMLFGGPSYRGNCRSVFL